MLTVYCVYWGDKYSQDYVYALKRMLKKHLRQRNRFVCITDQIVHGVETQKPCVDWPGWWQKVSLFKPGFAPGPALYLDLDVVVVGDLDDLVDRYTSDGLAMPKNWARSGHGGWQSSVMLWGVSPAEIYTSFTPDAMDRFWGDQEWITHVMGEAITPISGIYSYKYHCQPKPPQDAVVAAFHGKPDPHEVRDAWVVEARS